MITIFILIAVAVIMIAIGLKEDIVIEEYIAIVDIDEYGNMTVEETYVIDYNGEYNERWRDINYKKQHYKNPLFSDVSRELYENDIAKLELAEVLNVTVDGQDITRFVKTGYSFNGDYDKFGEPVECDPYSKYCDSMYLDATKAGGLQGETIIAYRYQINGMMTHYNDISELNYRLFEYMEGTVKKATVSIFLSADSSLYQENDFYCYGHGVSKGNINQAVIDKVNPAQPDFTYTASNIKNEEFFEIRLLFPRTLFENVDSKNIVKTNMFDKITEYEKGLAKETNIKYNVAQICMGISVVIVLLTVVIIIIVYKKYDKEYEPAFQGEYYRELPAKRTPAEMSYLYYFGTINDEDITATILDLIRKGYLELDQNGDDINDDDPNYILIKSSNPPKEIPELHESILMNWFINEIGDGKKVSFEQIEKYGKSYNNAEIFQKRTLEFKKSLKETCANYDFFEKKLAVGKLKALVYGVILFIISFMIIFVAEMFDIDASVQFIITFICALIYTVYVLSIKKRSVNGNEEFTKWKAFKNFLVDFSSFEDYPIPGVKVWEEYLVYATSLKIADKVMKQLEVKMPEFEESESTYYRYSYYGSRRRARFYYGLTHSLTTARMNTVTTIAAHNASKAGGGHGGGFSSGSSFGGGGGGGRSR